MLHLLAPPRVTIYPTIKARVVRGGGGSATVHALLVGVLALFGGGGGGTLLVDSRGPTVTMFPTLGATLTSVPRREPESPFREMPDEPSPGTIPLTIRNDVSGDEITIDLARIRQRRNDLFPFVTWDLRVLGERPATDTSAGIEWPSAFTPPRQTGAGPLTLSPGALQALVDRAWSRRERWTNLAELVNLAGRYDPDIGDLPRAFNGYVTGNVPQPYEQWAFPDPVFWITVTLAADDAPLLEFALGYLKQHPASRVTTELLFLLDHSAETSCDVLAQVLVVGTDELSLDATRRGNPEAYELANSLASAYRAWLWKYKVNAGERCVASRMAILRRIIETSPGGYGAADARFRLGAMLWAVGRRDDAVTWWRGMMPDERDGYGRVRVEVLGAIADGAADNNIGRINRLLLDEERRWRERADERLDCFGWAANRF